MHTVAWSKTFSTLFLIFSNDRITRTSLLIAKSENVSYFLTESDGVKTEYLCVWQKNRSRKM